MRKQYEHICDYCGKEHMIASTVYNRIKNGKQKKCYCSVECANNAKHTGEMVKCSNCGKMFYRNGYHIKKQEKASGKHFCSKKCESEYKIKSFDAREIRKCEMCGEEFECFKKSTQRFCSIKCQGRWQSTQLGELNPRYKHVEAICKWCGKPYMVKKSRVENGLTSFCSRDCQREHYRNILCKEEKYIEIHRQCALDNLANNKYSTINSEPQKILDKLLVENNIRFQREYPINYYSIDNYLPDFNLMIEVMGDFWHCNPTVYDTPINKIQEESVKRDVRKHIYVLEEYGVEILYLWEHDLKKNTDKCLNMIMEYINNKGVLSEYHSFNYINDYKTDIAY